MNKLELLNLKLASGEAVTFKKDNKFFIIGGAGKDRDGDYRTSDWYDSIKEAKQNIGEYGGFFQKYLQERLEYWEYIDSYPHAYGDRPEIGTKVLILPNFKEECEKYDLNCSDLSWNGNNEEMIGKIYEIEGYNGSDYKTLNEDKTDYWTLPRTAFVIAWYENLDEKVEEMTLAEVCKQLGRNIKIIK